MNSESSSERGRNAGEDISELKQCRYDAEMMGMGEFRFEERLVLLYQYYRLFSVSLK